MDKSIFCPGALQVVLTLNIAGIMEQGGCQPQGHIAGRQGAAVQGGAVEQTGHGQQAVGGMLQIMVIGITAPIPGILAPEKLNHIGKDRGQDLEIRLDRCGRNNTARFRKYCLRVIHGNQVIKVSRLFHGSSLPEGNN